VSTNQCYKNSSASFQTLEDLILRTPTGNTTYYTLVGADCVLQPAKLDLSSLSFLLDLTVREEERTQAKDMLQMSRHR